MADNYLPTASDDAARQQNAAQWFWLVGDIMAGADSSPRYPVGTVHDNGTLGPVPTGTDIAVGADGTIYRRGSAAIYGTQYEPMVGQPVQTGMTLSPLMLLLLAGAAFLLLRK